MIKLNRFKKLFIIGILSIFIMFSGIALWHVISIHIEDVESKYPGKIYNVNGHDMHIYGQGKGSPTVVITSGWGSVSPFIDFYPIHNNLAKITRVVVYDRPGYGWSKVAFTPRDTETIVSELHELLNKAGEKPPYIFVGHSYGTLEVIGYAQKYKEEVVGVVSIDGSSPEFYSKREKKGRGFYNIAKIGRGIGVFRILDSFGITANDHFRELPDDISNVATELINKNSFNDNVIEEGEKMEVSAKEVMEGGSIGDIPFIILTAGNSAKNGKWKESQERFKEWSNKSKQIVVDGATHYVQWNNPKVVERSIIELINKER